MLTVVTGWSPAGWEEYGRIFLSTFDRFWPKDVPLRIYVEELHPLAPYTTGERDIMLVELRHVPDALATIERYDNPTESGAHAREGWKDKERAAGYSFRYDAHKFCRQGLIPYHAAGEISAGHLLWLDGDVETLRKVPAGWPESLLPHGAHVAYLGREPKHSEIGFQLYKIPQAVDLLAEFRQLYVSGAALGLREWHSAFVWDFARKEVPQVIAHNMTPGGHGHVWVTSPLGQYLQHNKGARKAEARRRHGLPA